MKIAIIGAGFTGLSASYYLSQKDHIISVYEKEKNVGGLASGIKKNNWEWHLDKYYHHIFTSDKEVKKIAKEVGVSIVFLRPKTRSLIDNDIFSLSSPFDILRFSKLSLVERLQMGLGLMYLKLNPFWKSMENVSAEKNLPEIIGRKSYQILWKPLFSSKFGKYENEIPLSWFWARIKKRSLNLGYPEKGFQYLAEKIKVMSEKNGVNFYFQNEVKKISKEKSFINISGKLFDKVIYTCPMPLFTKIFKDLPDDYSAKISGVKTLASLNLILILDKPFFKDDTYWLNICNKDFPFVALVEHTNFIDKSHYNHKHILYISSYLPQNHPHLLKKPDELLKIYDPYLSRLDKNYRKSILNIKVYSDYYAQPVIPLNYSKSMPGIKTPINNVYLATMHQVYPWDRGVNYAVDLGKKVAEEIL